MRRVNLVLVAINIEQIGFSEGEFFRVLRWNRDVDEAEILGARGVFAPLRGRGSAWHLHDEIEVTLILKGQGTRFVGDQISRFTAPSLLLLGPHLPHCWRFEGPSSGLCVQLNLRRLMAAMPPGEKRELLRVSERAARGLAISGKVLRLASTRFEEIVAHDGVARFGLVLQLMGEIARARKSATRELSAKRFDVSHLAPGYQSIQQAILLILTRFREELTLAEVLTAAEMSKANFSRRFVAYTGRCYTDFLNEVRIDHACHRLTETSEEIGDIAFYSGYNNLAHFNRMFRRHRGTSPSEYRAGLSR